MKNKIYIISLLLGISVITGIALYMTPTTVSTTEENGIEVTLYKSPLCGCCTQYTAHLRENGFTVNVEETDDMESIKSKYNVPHDMQSCHTIAMGDYFVEGHMPIEAITKLLEEKPDIDGIALAGMPSGSPGMPGPKLGPFEVYQLTDGQASNFTTL